MTSNTMHVVVISLRSRNLGDYNRRDHISSTVYILLVVDIPHTKTHSCFALESEIIVLSKQRHGVHTQ